MRDKIFLAATLIICIILSIVWYQFFYSATRREILNMELETRRLHEVEREISELKARHKDLSLLAEEKELELDAARNFLPPTIAQEKFIDELYRAAESHNAKILSIKAGEIISAEKIQEQAIAVNLEADYISLLNFMREVLDGERLTTLENFQVERSEGKILSCELTLKIFAEPIKKLQI